MSVASLLWPTLLALVVLGLSLALRLVFVVPALRKLAGIKDSKPRRRSAGETVKVAVFLGSGGHTAEMLKLVAALDPKRYTQRVYFVSDGDQFSSRKATELESSLDTPHQPSQDVALAASATSKRATVYELPRARRVHQSFSSTPLTAAISLLACLDHVVVRPFKAQFTTAAQSNGSGGRRSPDRRDAVFADLLLLNGPGTCVPLVLAVYVRRILGLHSPHIIYVESFARVRSLSLSAKLLHGLVDTFVVQWPEASPHAKCPGWLV